MISRHCLDLEVSGRNASSDLFVPAFRLTMAGLTALSFLAHQLVRLLGCTGNIAIARLIGIL